MPFRFTKKLKWAAVVCKKGQQKMCFLTKHMKFCHKVINLWVISVCMLAVLPSLFTNIINHSYFKFIVFTKPNIWAAFRIKIVIRDLRRVLLPQQIFGGPPGNLDSWFPLLFLDFWNVDTFLKSTFLQFTSDIATGTWTFHIFVIDCVKRNWA